MTVSAMSFAVVSDCRILSGSRYHTGQMAGRPRRMADPPFSLGLTRLISVSRLRAGRRDATPRRQDATARKPLLRWLVRRSRHGGRYGGHDGRDRPPAGACYSPLGYLAKKESERDQLPLGSTRIQGVVNATVGRAIVEYPFCGTLHVGDDQESASSSAPDAATLCALLLAELPESAGTRCSSGCPRISPWRDLPPVDEVLLKAVQTMLSRLRSKRRSRRRGAVVFEGELPDTECLG